MVSETLTLGDLLPTEWGEPCFDPFEPCASYSAALDCIVYLTEDESARADRVDQFLTILWHPQDDRVIGIKLKGIRYLFEFLQSAVEMVTGSGIPEEKFIPIVGAINVAMKVRLGSTLSEYLQKDRSDQIAMLTRSYELARGLVGDATINAAEIAAATCAAR